VIRCNLDNLWRRLLAAMLGKIVAEPAQQLDGAGIRCCPKSACAGAARRLGHHRYEPVLFHDQTNPPHVTRADAPNLGRLHPRQLLGDRLPVHFPPVIAHASRHTRRSLFCIEWPYRSQRTCLNVYAPDISNVYDTGMVPTVGPVSFSLITTIAKLITGFLPSDFSVAIHLLCS